MTEVIFSAPDLATIVKAATATGFYDPVAKRINSTGVLPEDGGWFYNFVGTVQVPTGRTVTDRMGNPQPETAADPNQWGRLRVNGPITTLPQIIATCRANGVTIYELIQQEGKSPFWSADGGATPAPDWVANVGVIA